MEVFCLIQVRNEERFLPGFLHHIAPHVDGIIALDDCSTDATMDILRAEPRVVSVLRERRPGTQHANEVTNRHRLILEAARLNATWVLCADADERFEERFLRRLRAEAEKGDRRDQPGRFVKIVNLWDGGDHYRVDGRCGPRWTARMFRVPATITRRVPGLHQPWFPPELDKAPRGYMPALLYHLKMIERKDREARFRKFSLIDPDLRHQPIGYGHLVDETGLKLKPVLPFRHFMDLPADALIPRPAPLPATSGSGQDPEFVRRFRIADGPCPGAGTTMERCQLFGFDFEAIFADVQARQR
jgi:glycosyltransferase involved in cell wall biosynthesis